MPGKDKLSLVSANNKSEPSNGLAKIGFNSGIPNQADQTIVERRSNITRYNNNFVWCLLKNFLDNSSFTYYVDLLVIKYFIC